MCCKVASLLLVVVMFATVPTFGATRDSADFVGVSFEGSTLPGAAAVPWDLGMTGPLVGGVFQYSESSWASSDGSVLNVNTYPNANGNRVSWYLPGTEGGKVGQVGYRHWPSPPNPECFNNPWQPDLSLGYTLEMRIQVLSSNTSQAGFTMFAAEGYDPANPYNAATFRIDFKQNGIFSPNAGVLYDGDMSSAFHTLRVTRNAGFYNNTATTAQVFVDGELVYTAQGGISADAFWTPSGGSSLGAPEDFLYMGTALGGGGANSYNLNIDYIRADFTGAYTPVPEPLTLTLLASGLGLVIRRRK